MTEADAAASDYVISTTSNRVTTYSDVSFTKLDKDYSDLMGQKVKVIFKNGKTNDVLGVYATSDNVIYKTRCQRPGEGRQQQASRSTASPTLLSTPETRVL